MMKTMYKGVLTVTAATLVASAAIIATNANTKDATENEGKTEQQNTVSTTDSKVVAETAQQKIASDAADKTADAGKEAKDGKAVDAETKDADYPPPPPSPFEGAKAKTDSATTEVVSRPLAPTKPAAMEAPKAPVAPAVNANKATETVKKEVHQADIKAPEAPKAEINAPEKPAITKEKVAAEPPVAVEANATTDVAKPVIDAGVTAPEAPSKSKALEMLEAAKKATTTETGVNAVTNTLVAPKANINAPEKPKAPELKVPEAPAEIHAPKKPENTGLKAPEAPKVQVHFPEPIRLPQNANGAAGGKQSVAPIEYKMPAQIKGNQQPMRMIFPQGMMMPQGMPPQGMVMPQGMPPQGMMMPQMINGQRMMMVPVYPINMGKPVYPYNYQMPFPNMMPQGNFNPRQAVKPSPQQQQAPAEKAEK